jgi:hypothetical protein
MITFPRSRSRFLSQYLLNGNVISRTIDYVMDLGFKLSYNLDPSTHIEHVCCKSSKNSIMRLSKIFRLKLSIEKLM